MSDAAHLAHRLALTCETREQLQLALNAFARGDRADGLRHAHTPNHQHPRTAFLFTGQGAQYYGMGSELYKTQPSFRRTLEQCDEILRPVLERPLLSVLYGDEESALDETAYTQPALFALEYALAELWRAWASSLTSSSATASASTRRRALLVRSRSKKGLGL